jgi:hypothetical protein
VALARRIGDNATVHARQLTALGDNLSALESSFATSRDLALADAATAHAMTREREAEKFARREATIARARQAEADTARGSIAATIETLAAGAASAPWTTEAWASLAAVKGPADFARFGTVTIGEASVPAILPLQPGRGWYLAGDAGPAQGLLLQTALRLVGQSPAPNIVVEAFDPKATAALAPLAALRSLNGSAFAGATADAEDFDRRLDGVLDRAVRNAELAVTGGARSLTDLWRSGQSPEGVLTVVCLVGYPYGVDPRLQETLRRLRDLGPTAGVILLIQEDRDVVPERDVHPAELRDALHVVTASEATVVADGYPAGIEVTRDAHPAPEVIAAVFADAKARASGDKGPTVRLDELITADLTEPWSRSSIESLDATIGRVGRDPLVVSFRTQNPPHPNLLTGGQVGTGKSMLLLDFVYSLAVAYSPDELELMLLDFKQGVEFNVFGPDETGGNWLPHASVLCLESNQEFGLAVLRHVVGELERRSQLFKTIPGVSSIVGYRELGNQLPRLLLIVDEFHELFTGDDDGVAEAVRHLETIARQGRSAGVHLLLASQTTSGITALGAKADAIFAQFPLRISLKNSPEESEAILARQNRAAADLTYRGELIVNRDGGNPSANERGVAGFVDRAYFAEFQRWMWARSPGRAPRIFSARSATPWNRGFLDALARPGDGRLKLWAGQPVAVTDEPAGFALDRNLDQTVALVGADDGDRLGPAVLAGFVVTAGLQLRAGERIAVLTGDGEQEPAWLATAAEVARGRGVEVEHVPASRAAAYLREQVGGRTRDEVDRLLLVVLAVPQIPGLDDGATEPEYFGFSAVRVQQSVEYDLAGDGAANRDGGATAREVLVRAAHEGALTGVHLVGSWPNAAAITELLGYSHRGVLGYVTTGLGTEDLRALSGQHRAQVEGTPRVGLIDRSASAGLLTLVPFEPWTAAHGVRFLGDAA